MSGSNGTGNNGAQSFALSLFDGKHDATPKPVQRTWADLCARITQPLVRAEKDGALFSPATFNPLHRKKANVASVSMLVLDYDHAASLETDCEQWRLAGVTFAAYTTHSSYQITESNPDAEERFRVMIPLAEPIPADKFPLLWEWARQISQGKIDRSAKDASRMFYTPVKSAPDARYRFDIQEGALLDWRTLDLKEPERPQPVPHQNGNGNGHADKYARAALEQETGRVATAATHRNDQLNHSAYSLGQLVGAGVLSRSEVESSLERAVVACGLDRDSKGGGMAGARATIKSGIDAGIAEPRAIPERKPRPAVQVAVKPAPAGNRDEVAEFIDQLEQEADPERARSPQYWRQTHEGMARELLNRYGQDVRYVHDLSKDLTPDNFAAWNGQFWEFRAKAVGVIAEFQRKMTSEFREFVKQQIGEYEDDPDALDKRQKALVMFGKTIESSGFKAGWKQELKGFIELHVALSAFDSDPFALNCLNGTLDLRSGTLRPHSRTDLLSKSTHLNHNPDAQCPEWLKFLAGVFRDDEELIAYVRRAIGYSLTGDTREQCLFLCHGQGSNGKSTLLTAIRNILGDYARAAVVRTFMNKPQDSATSNDLAMLAGRRFVTAVETNEGQRLDEALVKQASGGDPVSARFLFSEFFEFVPTFKLWFGMNHEPEVRGTDEGIWRRLKKIPFLAHFEGTQKDESLPSKLRAEAEGILTWAVDGCVEWEQDGLREPSVVSDAVKEYREEQDVIGQFLERRCERGEGDKYLAKASDLYREYMRDAERNHVKSPMSATAFGRKLTDKGILPTRDTEGDRARRGIRLKVITSSYDEPPY